jgi:signal transduction histidine kinase/DNA-binding NarL/FixJ family response regulator
MIDQLDQEKFRESRQVLTVITNRMAVPLFMLFWLLDLIYVPHYKWEFLGIRLSIIPVALVTHWLLKRASTYRQAERAGLFLVFWCAAIINLMIYIIGAKSLYVIPLQLVAIGGLSIMPWSRGYFIAAILSVYAPYFVIELSRLNGNEAINQLVVNIFFIMGVIVISAVIHLYREQLRQRELHMRKNLENEVAQRTKTEQELIDARDQALAATQAKDAFLANMSHEIRTPLTAIIGFAEYALDQDVSRQERTAALGTIVSSGNHLLHVINDILDFSKIEANSIDPEYLATDPIQLAGEVQSLVTHLANKKGILLKLEYEFPLPACITTDPVRVKQILINLCSNAIKFSDQGPITLTLAYDNSDNAMIYRVKDSGIGMTPEQIEHIFDPFKQADSSITRRYGGTGLGLSLSKRLAQMLGGSLTVTSMVNRGSEFVLSITAGQMEDAHFIHHIDEISGHVISSQATPVGKALDGEILLAEDNENNQRLLALYLNKMGARLTIAENGEEALNRAKNKNFDLILMDMQMPVLSGIDAVRQLRDIGYTQPIVALTANATKEDRQQCLEAGCNDFLTKPVTRDRLFRMVAQYLSPATESTGAIYSSLLDQEPELDDIISKFVDKLPDIIADIRAAGKANDWQKLQELIHNLKGMGGGFGFPQLSEQAAIIEKQIRQNNINAVAQSIEELTVLSRHIRAGVRQPHSPVNYQTG